ncbi:hypothetical protein CHRYSEOSP005_31150 [Chryseobacterium sp. Alg-005]|uniref:hypothetical protein n=1 Tax=Chryseobacterium sp. Alg-005 TaxID=3159516 RepID=UPI003555BBE4
MIITLCFKIKALEYSNKQINNLAQYTSKLLSSNIVEALKKGKQVWDLSEENEYDKGKVQALHICNHHLRRSEIILLNN